MENGTSGITVSPSLDENSSKTGCSRPFCLRARPAAIGILEVIAFTLILLSFSWDECLKRQALHAADSIRDASLSIYIILNVWAIVAGALLFVGVWRMLQILIVPWLVLLPFKFLLFGIGLIFAIVDVFELPRYGHDEHGDRRNHSRLHHEEMDKESFALSLNITKDRISKCDFGPSTNNTSSELHVGYFNSVAGVRMADPASQIILCLFLIVGYAGAGWLVYRVYTFVRLSRSRPADPPTYQPPINTLALNTYQSPVTARAADVAGDAAAGRRLDTGQHASRSKLVLPPLRRP